MEEKMMKWEEEKKCLEDTFEWMDKQHPSPDPLVDFSFIAVQAKISFCASAPGHFRHLEQIKICTNSLTKNSMSLKCKPRLTFYLNYLTFCLKIFK